MSNLKGLRVEPGEAAAVEKRDPASRVLADFKGLRGEELDRAAKRRLEWQIDELASCQKLLWASDRYSLLVILQALDAAGKDSAIRHVMTGLNPQGCHVVSFKQPSAEEQDHDWLWRYNRALPERGRIGVFNRSYYEDVLVVRVRPELLDQGQIPDGPRDERFWQRRYDTINAFEAHLHESGTRVIKIFLNVSREEQRKRFLSRLEDPTKQWKFSLSDLDVRDQWAEYMQAYESALTATSTAIAPWYVVPADHKRVAHAVIASLLVEVVKGLQLSYPEVGEEQRAELDEGRRRLAAEDS